MTKKYKMEIISKDSKEVVKTVNSNSLKYIVRMWNDFFLTSTGNETTALLDHLYKVINNENNKDITSSFKGMARGE